jgi:hypothetical protein
MQNFTKYLIISFLALVLGLTYYVSSLGVGLKKLTDAQIKAEAEKEQKSSNSRAGRSYFRNRSIRGGGFRFGK